MPGLHIMEDVITATHSDVLEKMSSVLVAAINKRK